ncbi:MAG: PAS domain-containing sensor histidine kinase [Hyphomonadaceae bacterium]|nr:PAS domain-containing sensor histidine kinase [Hyphomonadaceae bacterium]
MTTTSLSERTDTGVLRLGTAGFLGGFVVAAALTIAATVLAVSGAGPLRLDSPLVLALLGSSLLISAGLGVLLALRIVRIAGARSAPGSGARLHLRFVSLFSAAAVTPAVVVALFLGATMSRGIEEWFSDRVKTVVENAALVGRSYVQAAQENLRGEVLAMATDLNRAQRGLTAEYAAYNAYLEAQTEQRYFASAYVIDGQGRVLAAARTPDAPPYTAPSPQGFGEAASGELTMRLFEDAGYIRALYRLSAYDNAYLYVVRYVDPDMLRQLRTFDQAVTDYRATEDSRAQLQILFALAYLATAVLILLGAVWLGLSNASRVSEPIGRLAEAARRVASGDLNARVAVGRERDEVDALGRAFNRMTAQLDSQRSDLINARQEAEDRSRFTQAVLANVSAGVVGLDGEGRITAANSSAADLLAVSVDALEGRRLDEVAPEFADIVAAAREAAPIAPRRVDMARAGSTRHLSVRVSGADNATGIVLTFDDMTKLVAAQRQEAWKDVARRIAHEIKNPLTPIQLSAERLQRRFGAEIQSDTETFQRCTETILRQVADIGRMVDEFSGFARMPTPRFEPVDIIVTAREAMLDQRLSFSDVRFDVEGDEDALTMICDGRLLAQALTNVIKNAAEAIQTRRGKEGEPKEGRVLMRIAHDERDVTIDIIDNGIGFPANDRDRLVEPYVTTRTKGTGLGLAIVRRVVEDHGGSLVLSDAPGAGPGAMVRLILPRQGISPAMFFNGED